MRPVHDDDAGSRIGVVVITRNRCASLRHTLDRLAALPERPPVVVVDNGSQDGTVAAVRTHHPGVRLIPLPDNRGALARNVGVAAAGTEFVAFADDDSWWEPGSLTRAVGALAAHPGVAAVIGQVRLSPDDRLDPVSRKLASGLLPTPDSLPGPRVLSFPAFAAVVRRSAFEQVGGFDALLFFGGEEQLLAVDLAAAGWSLCHLDGAVARHAPDHAVSPARWAQQTRNDVLVLWLRRPLRRAARATGVLARRSVTDRAAARALLGVLRRLPAALRRRQPVGADLERELTVSERPFPPQPLVRDRA